MTKFIGRVAAVLVLTVFAGEHAARAALIFSQYAETDSGSVPKAVEIWNSGSTAIDFSTQNLQIYQGTNGAALTAIAQTLLSSGTLAPNSVLVMGTSDVGTYLTNQGLGGVSFVTFAFTFNGDDALGLYLGGSLVDVVGQPGVDPGAAWSASGVSTANQNIEIRPGITTATTAGWSDPSLRFQTVSTTPSQAGGLAGFGVAPVAVPEPTALVFAGLGLSVACASLRRRIHRG